jgi:hypothetical protein
MYFVTIDVIDEFKITGRILTQEELDATANK